MTGVFACLCGRAFPTKAAASGLKRLTGAGVVEVVKDLCTPEGAAEVVANARERGIDRIALAGCATLERSGVAARIAAEAGLPGPYVTAVIVAPGAEAAATGAAATEAIEAAGAAPAIRRAVVALEAMPGFDIRREKLAQAVLVVGAGPAGLEAARALAALGHAVTVIDRSADIPAAASATSADGFRATGSTTLATLDGFPGRFTARLRRPDGIEERTFGAVVVATGLELADPGRPPFVPGKVLPLPALSGHLAGLRLRELPRHLAILLDFEVDEGKASFEAAYRASVEALKRYRANVTLLARDAKVAALELNQAYDDAREAGVVVLKYAGRPTVRVTGATGTAGTAGATGAARATGAAGAAGAVAGGAGATGTAAGGVTVVANDSIAGADVAISCDLLAISPWGLRSPADPALAGVLGLDLDELARFQDNSSRLLPAATNRRGIFVVGACRGETWLPSVLRDAKAAALEVDALLARKQSVVDTAHAVVDGDKCVLCLTCVRTCPFGAMGIHAADRRADCRAELCRQCGTCAGECPNKAITLPAWSDPVVMTLAGAAGAGDIRAGAGEGRA